MFRILVLQRLYNFGDDQTEYLILDRLSFMRFPGISPDSPVPGARWAKKHNETHYGCKNHVKADKDSKHITGYAVTDASVHDSRALSGLIDEKDKVLYADSPAEAKNSCQNCRKQWKSRSMKKLIVTAR